METSATFQNYWQDDGVYIKASKGKCVHVIAAKMTLGLTFRSRASEDVSLHPTVQALNVFHN